jgi:hypothetical protein
MPVIIYRDVLIANRPYSMKFSYQSVYIPENVHFYFVLMHFHQLMFHQMSDQLDQMLHLYLYLVVNLNLLLFVYELKVVRLELQKPIKNLFFK